MIVRVVDGFMVNELPVDNDIIFLAIQPVLNHEDISKFLRSIPQVRQIVKFSNLCCYKDNYLVFKQLLRIFWRMLPTNVEPMLEHLCILKCLPETIPTTYKKIYAFYK